MPTSSVRCCIAGGGPAGVMLGFLLARAGIEVAVLEKWPDFFRDFRGDTIHPSTMELLGDLGLLEEFLQLPHDKTHALKGCVGTEEITLADFSHLPVRCPFIAFIPQWDFLNFIAENGRRFPGFHLLMETEVTDVLEQDGRITGIRARTKEGPLEIRAELVVGADGRHSTVRERAQLPAKNYGAPMDVLWFRLSRKESDPEQSLGRINSGRIMVMLNRTTYWQCGFAIPKGEMDSVKAAGLPAFRERIASLAPSLHDRVQEIASWDDVKLLSVTVDCLTRWYRAGLLCIGDAAHAMSPIGGVGINLAIQDAVAAANILIPAFQKGVPTEADLRAVQRRRMFPTRMTQRLQLFLQTHVIGNVLQSASTPKLAWPFRLLQRFPVLRRIPARIIGLGVRPEHFRQERTR